MRGVLVNDETSDEQLASLTRGHFSTSMEGETQVGLAWDATRTRENYIIKSDVDRSCFGSALIKFTALPRALIYCYRFSDNNESHL